MKMKVLPKAPIQIQRDELLEKVRLLHIENQNLKAQVTDLKQREELLKNEVNTKNILISSLQTEISIKNNLLTEQSNKERSEVSLLEKIALLENTIKLSENQINELKADKEELKKDKIKLTTEIDNLKLAVQDVISYDSSFNVKFKTFNLEDMDIAKSEKLHESLQLSGVSVIEENNEI